MPGARWHRALLLISIDPFFLDLSQANAKKEDAKPEQKEKTYSRRQAASGGDGMPQEINPLG